jgi:hypothetical protein
MKARNVLIALALALSLTSCAGLKTRSQQLEASCAVALSANNAIAAGVRYGQVSSAQQDAAIAANEYIEPVCSNPNAPTVDSVKKAAFDRALAELLRIRGTLN